MDAVCLEVVASMMDPYEIARCVFSTSRTQFSVMESHRWESRCSTDFTVSTGPLLYDPYDFFVHLFQVVIFVIVDVIVI